MPLHAKVDETHGEAELDIHPVYGRDIAHAIPKHRIPVHPMPADAALPSSGTS